MQERRREVSVKNAKNQQKKVKARVRVHNLTESWALALDKRKSLERRRKDREEGRNIGRKDGAEEMRKNGKRGERTKEKERRMEKGWKKGRKKRVYLSGDLDGLSGLKRKSPRSLHRSPTFGAKQESVFSSVMPAFRS